MEPDIRLREELLRVSRSHFSVDEVERAKSLVAWMLGRDPDSDERTADIAVHLRQRVIEIVESATYPAYLQEATMLMLGADRRTEGRPTRKRIKELMAAALTRRRSSDDPERALTIRAVENIERNEIIPAIVALVPILQELAIPRYEIEQTVIDVDSTRDAYVLRTRVTLSVNTANLIIAVTPDEPVADWICSEMPSVLDVYSPREGGFARFTAAQLISGVWQRMPPFRRDSELETQFQHLHPYGQMCEFWRSDGVIFGEQNQFRVTCEFELNLSSRYLYWVAPHRLFLNSLRVNLEAFRAHASSIEIYPRLGSRPALDVDQDFLSGTVELNRWVERAASIEVRWTT